MKRSGRRSRKKLSLGSFVAVLAVALLLLWAENQGLLAGPPADQRQTQDVISFSPAEQPEGLEVYFLDVGQGDSALLRLPNGTSVFHILIDTGEYAYADGLTDGLRALGVEKIDALICSHPHTDHMGCMARIVQRFEIGSFYMPRLPDDRVPTTSAYEALLNALEKKGITAIPLEQGVEIPCPPEASLQVSAPRPQAEWEDLNNYSGVLRLTYGETSFLFTGDAEKESEALILQDGYELHADVLKCGHHGSRTSTSAKFLKAVEPRYAVISCGKDNSYGHPHDGVLEKLQKLGTTVYRTDEDHTVLAKSDGSRITFETGLPSIAANETEKRK